MQILIEFNENQKLLLYRPSHLEELKHKSEYFEVPDLETRIQRHDNPPLLATTRYLTSKELPIQIL